jgi:hypothetical protein
MSKKEFQWRSTCVTIIIVIHILHKYQQNYIYLLYAIGMQLCTKYNITCWNTLHILCFKHRWFKNSWSENIIPMSMHRFYIYWILKTTYSLLKFPGLTARSPMGSQRTCYIWPQEILICYQLLVNNIFYI